MPSNTSLVTITSANWNTCLLAWRTRRPPVLAGIPPIKLAAPKEGANLNKSEYSGTPHHRQPPGPSHNPDRRRDE